MSESSALGELKPDPQLKDSGVPWLGKIPAHWGIVPAFAVFKERQEKNLGMRESTVLSLSYGRIIVKPPEKLRGLVPESFETYQIVNPGNIVVRTTDLQNDQKSLRVGQSQHRGIITSAYMCLETTQLVDNQFGYQFLNAYDLLKIIYGFGSGLRQNLAFADIKRMPVLLPPIDEQRAIVRFLNDVDRKIRKYIRAKQKLIKLLEEQKQAMIQHAISRDFVGRLPLNVLAMPRQVPALNEWRSMTVGRLIQKGWLTIQDGNHGELHPKTSEFVDDGIPFLMAKDVRPTGLSLVTCAKLTESRARRLRIGFAQAGDVLLTHKATVGQVGVVPDSIQWPFVMLSPQVTYYRPLNSAIESRYLVLYFQALIFQEQLTLLGLNQSTRPYIGLLEQRHLVVCFPSAEKQREIVKECEDKTRPLNVGIEVAQEEISLLREYRTRLIGDVITGKLDVREAAASLGNEPDESTCGEEYQEPTAFDDSSEESSDSASEMEA